MTIEPRRGVTVLLATVAFATALGARAQINPWLLAAAAALASGGLALWSLRGELRRLLVWRAGGAALALGLGGIAVLLTHGAFAAAAAWVPALASRVDALYAALEAPPGPERAAPVVAAVVAAEELVWRGAAFGLLGRARAGAREGALATALYAVPQLAGSWILVATALALGALLAAVRLRTGRITEPLLVHLVWSLGIFCLVPLR